MTGGSVVTGGSAMKSHGRRTISVPVCTTISEYQVVLSSTFVCVLACRWFRVSAYRDTLTVARNFNTCMHTYMCLGGLLYIVALIGALLLHVFFSVFHIDW